MAVGNFQKYKGLNSFHFRFFMSLNKILKIVPSQKYMSLFLFLRNYIFQLIVNYLPIICDGQAFQYLILVGGGGVEKENERS